jgi:UDP-2,3-diacylglucosamine pyrophosphatase LpxH
MLEKGIKVIYISGNHDEFLRRFNNIEIGKLSITDQLVLDIDGNRTWIFHGDVFDHIIHRAKWLAKIGSAFYGLLTILNKTINASIKILGFNEVLLYKKFKTKILTQKEKPSRFEVSVCKTAINKKFDTVICGHTHYPTERLFTSIYGSVRYINCGDWVEHLSAAEFSDNQWRLYYFNNTDEETIDDFEILEPTNFYKQALNDLLSVNF